MSISHTVLLIAPKEKALEIYQAVFDAIQAYAVKARNEVIAEHEVKSFIHLPADVRDEHKMPSVFSYGFKDFRINFSAGEDRSLFICDLGSYTSYDEEFGEGNKFSFSVNAFGKHQEIIEAVKIAVYPFGNSSQFGKVVELLNDEVVA